MQPAQRPSLELSDFSPVFESFPLPGVWQDVQGDLHVNAAYQAIFGQTTAWLAQIGSDPTTLLRLTDQRRLPRLCRVQCCPLPDGQGQWWIIEDLHAFTTDPLTGLPGRQVLQLDTTRGLQGGSVLLLDINRFKVINDTHGHTTGDAVLGVLGELLQEFSAQVQGSAYRLGGDEFLLISPLPLTAQQVRNLQAEYSARIQQRLGLRSSFAVGQADCGRHRHSLCALMQRADHQMYRLKDRNERPVQRRNWLNLSAAQPHLMVV